MSQQIEMGARLVSRLYANEMGRTLEPAQYSLLSVLNRVRGRGQNIVARSLGLDKTALQQNLRTMEENGWIEPVTSADREHWYRLTADGKRVFAATKPRWRRAHEKLRSVVTPGEWETITMGFSVAARAAGLAMRSGSQPAE